VIAPGRAAPEAVIGLAGCQLCVQLTLPAGTGPLAVGELNVHETVSTSVPGGCSTVMVAEVNVASALDVDARCQRRVRAQRGHRRHGGGDEESSSQHAHAS
jgi:hypothetical protein